MLASLAKHHDHREAGGRGDAGVRPELRRRMQAPVDGGMVDLVDRLHDRVVVAVRVALDDVVRLLLEEPERQPGQHDPATAADGQRQKVLAAFALAERLLFLLLHGRGVYGRVLANATN
jgi:hypothetical protein